MSHTPPRTNPDRGATLTGYAGFILIGWNAVLVPSLIRSIEGAFRVSDAAFALFFFVSALLYTAGSLGGGLLTERIGRRSVLGLAAGLIGLGLAGEAVAPAWAWFLLAAPIVNLGAGAIDGGINGLFLDLFRDARGSALNFLHLFFSVGALASPFIVGQIVGAGVSWRVVMLGTGVVAAGVALRLFAAPMPSGRNLALPRSAEEVESSERSLVPFLGLAAGICFYVASEIGISNWLVKFLSDAPVTTATGILSGFWAGLAVGRLVSRWVAERVDYVAFTVSCFALMSVSIFLALLAPWLAVEALCFAFAGLFSGPIYPMIMAIGGNIYPHRLARLSGSLSAAAVVGSIGYPPIMGLMAASVGIGAGIFGAGLLGIPGAAAVLLAAVASRRLRAGTDAPAIEIAR